MQLEFTPLETSFFSVSIYLNLTQFCSISEKTVVNQNAIEKEKEKKMLLFSRMLSQLANFFNQAGSDGYCYYR